MRDKEIRRVVFYSKNDGAIGYNLSNAEKLLNSYTPNKEFTINDLLEFYNIKLHFDNNIYLDRWGEEDKKKYHLIIDSTAKLLNNRISEIKNQNLEKTASEIEFRYRGNFWNLINESGAVLYQISSSVFKSTLRHPNVNIRDILSNEKIVKKFNKEIRDYLLSHKSSAEILLSYFEQKETSNNKRKLHFPKSLTLKDKELIINNYLDSEQPNLNYVRLIEKSKDSHNLKLSPETKYKAREKSEELNKEIFAKGNYSSFKYTIGLDSEQEEPFVASKKGKELELIYSKKYLDSQNDDISLFKVINYLFGYLEETSLIDILSKERDFSSFQKLFMQSKNEYPKSITFKNRELLSNAQLVIFDNYLNKRNNSIEQLINSFIKHLNSLHNYKDELKFEIRISDIDYLSKIRTLLPDFDFLLKQYNNLAEKGVINIDVLKFSSNPIGFGQIKSLVNKKYIYINDKLISQLKYIFFSDQSDLLYTDKHQSKHNNFYDLIINEKVNIIDYLDYQKEGIRKLKEDGYLKIDKNGFIDIENTTLLYIIREFERNGLLSYWHYPPFIKDELDSLIKNKKVIKKSTLFSDEELKYFNFYLNKKDYTNGYDLRNKYLHGTNSQSVEQHKIDYYLILKTIILALLKIEDDIQLKNFITANNLE